MASDLFGDKPVTRFWTAPAPRVKGRKIPRAPVPKPLSQPSRTWTPEELEAEVQHIRAVHRRMRGE